MAAAGPLTPDIAHHAALDEARFDHFVKLRDEQEAAATTLAARRSEEKVQGKALNKRLKDKYGRR